MRDLMESKRDSIVMSPLTVKKRRLEHEIEIEDKKLENEWSCCSGSKVDKRCIIYFTQVSLGLLIIGFSLYKLSTSDDCNETNLYVGMLSSTVGLFLPSPSMK